MKLKIALVQSTLVWEDPAANRAHFDAVLAKIDNADVFVLPETFSTGFTMHPERCAEPHLGETVQWMMKQANRLNAAITGSVVTQTEWGYFNRMYWVTPEGNVDFYDKRHLFSLAGEEKKYQAGSAKKIVNYRGFSICLQVCYDLRFPAFVRNQENYDGILYVANWPKPRMHAWDSLLVARAIENQCYVVAVNRVGEDASGMPYVGHSQAIDPMGDYLISPYEQDEVRYVTWEKAVLEKIRTRFPFLADRDTIRVD